MNARRFPVLRFSSDEPPGNRSIIERNEQIDIFRIRVLPHRRRICSRSFGHAAGNCDGPVRERGRSEGVFKSEGFCVDFDQDGRFRTIEYAGRKPFTIGYECCASLKAKEDFIPQMVYENGPGRIVCTRNSELGAKSDDYSEKAVWTVTEDTVEFAGEVCVREGVKWNAYVACAILGFPIDFFAGRTLELTDAKGGVHRIDYPIEFNKSSCVIGIPFVALSNGEWKIELEDAQVGNFSDLRAWNSDYANLRLCPKDGLKWTGKVSDGGTYKWKWRITRLKK